MAKDTLGREWVGGSSKQHTPWWTDEVKEVVKVKTKKMRRWPRNRITESRLEYVIARREVCKTIKRSKFKNWEHV